MVGKVFDMKTMIFARSAGLIPALVFSSNVLAADLIDSETITTEEFVERSRPAFFGEAEIYGSHFHLSGSAVEAAEDVDYQSIGGGIKLGTNFAGHWMIQGDLAGEATNVGSADDSYKDSITATGHVAYRNDMGLIGAFGGYLATDQDNDATDSSNRYFVGGEAQYFVGDTATIYLQGGYLDGTGGDDDLGEDSITDAWFARIAARYFFTPKTRLDGSFAYADGIMDNDIDSVDLYTLGVGLDQSVHG
ncbi:hypothetical protein [Hoeflea sp.]|uniref:hypothetical protein n=1 Tax=Hoeflea sp. TaxID=1940281 RepID=UPI003B0141D6